MIKNRSRSPRTSRRTPRLLLTLTALIAVITQVFIPWDTATAGPDDGDDRLRGFTDDLGPRTTNFSPIAPLPGHEVRANRCTALVDRSGVRIDPDNPCHGVIGVQVDERGFLEFHQRTENAPIISIAAEGTGGLATTIQAGPSGGLYATKLLVHLRKGDRDLDLRRADDRALLAGKGGIRVRWMHPTSGGPKTETFSPHQRLSGCVVRFLPEDGGRPSIHANSTHLCAGVRSVGIDAQGRLSVTQTGTSGLSLDEVWATSDESLTSRGIRTSHSTGGTASTTFIFTDATGRRLDLNRAADRSRMACSYCNAWVGWIHEADGPLTRVTGQNRYETAAELTRESHPWGSRRAYVATAATYPDALAAAAAAGSRRAPVLLVRPDRLPAVTAEALTRLRTTEIIVAGGPTAVGEPVITALERIAPTERIAGDNRYATADALALDTYPRGAETVFLTTGLDFPDALSASAVAGRAGAPILLARQNGIPASTRATLEELAPSKVVVVGSEVALGRPVTDALDSLSLPWERVGGSDRYDTAARLATWFSPEADEVWTATGTDFPDALTASAAAAKASAPLLLAKPDSLPRVTGEAVGSLGATGAVVVGGKTAVSDTVLGRLGRILLANGG